MVMKAQVWLLISLYNANSSSTYHFILPAMSIDRFTGMPILTCMYLIILASFLYSSTFVYFNIVQYNETANCMYGRARFGRYNRCFKKWWKHFASVWDSLINVVCGRCCWFLPHVLWGATEHLSNVVDHSELYFALRGLADGHPEVLVDFSLCGGHFVLQYFLFPCQCQ